MFTTLAIAFFAFISFSFFTPESIVTMLAGALVTIGVTQWIKRQTGVLGVAAAFLAFALSFVAAALAVVISLLLTGGPISWDTIPQAGLQIFGLATMAYKVFLNG